MLVNLKNKGRIEMLRNLIRGMNRMIMIERKRAVHCASIVSKEAPK